MVFINQNTYWRTLAFGSLSHLLKTLTHWLKLHSKFGNRFQQLRKWQNLVVIKIGAITLWLLCYSNMMLWRERTQYSRNILLSMLLTVTHRLFQKIGTPPKPEILCVTNVRAIVVCGFLIDPVHIHLNWLDWLCYLASNVWFSNQRHRTWNLCFLLKGIWANRL